MADRLDVAARLTEGRPAVEHTQSYVQACQLLGYQNPDLTSRPTQIRDWYDSEEGLDLRALDRDCAELRAAEAAAAEALRTQYAQVGQLATAWTGPGGDSAVQLLQRHCDVGNTVATELRAAAQRCESLRDNLWCLVDDKVATTIAVDERTQAQRQAWLAAAAAITTGAGDWPSAAEVVRQQVMPYVDNDIRNDWMTVMHSTLDGVTASYDMVTDRMAVAPTACFEFPGDLGPDWQPVQQVPHTAPASAASVAPSAAAPSLSVGPAPDATTGTLAPDWASVLDDAPGLPAGGLGGGSGGLGGLAGLASRIVDAMGDLIGSAADQLSNADPIDADAYDEDAFQPDDERDVDDAGSDEPVGVVDPDEADGVDEVDDTEAEPHTEAQPADGPLPAEATAAPIDGAAPVAAVPTGEPVPAASEGSTPCEIAADQLPQAGQ